MKVCIIQPLYPTKYELSDDMFKWELDVMDQCDSTMDLIVFPESTDVPCYAPDRTLAMVSHEKYAAKLLDKASQTAKRCNAVVFINAYRKTESGVRNTTFAFDREGNEVGHYYKQHLTPGETKERKLDSGYSFEFSEPTILEIDGIRYGFLTCYDFYFYEAFSKLAMYKPDIIIGCSHQRTDTHQALEMITRFCAYNCNAYVVRASVTLGEDSAVGGCSMVVSPEGEVLANMGSRVGMETVEIDPLCKYYKPGGFNNPLMAHYEYIEKGRRPWKYRPAGSSVVPYDAIMPYPRTCAHRGFNSVAPENSMPAYGAAVAMGAEEIEFDLWWTKDGEVVSCHDRKLSRVSTGEGFVTDLTYEELLAFDFGVKTDEHFAGMKILRFEEILKKLACQTIMNIHIKCRNNTEPLPEEYLKKIIDLIRKYDCTRHVYFMCGNDYVLEQLGMLAPDIARCVGAGDDQWGIVDRAIRMGCQKVQLFKPYFNESMIHKAHEHGIICNVFYADDPEEARRYLEMGIDVILTNDFNRINQVVNQYKEENVV